MEGKTNPVDVQLDRKKATDLKNRDDILKPIIDTVITCGHMGIPLRGHRDEGEQFPPAGEYSKVSGVGNFVEMLNLRIRVGDVNLKNHYDNHKRNASYFSKTTQNEIIDCCGQVITDEIISEVKESKFYSILADEVMDSANKEQMALVLRYVDADFNIQENFVKFIHLKSGLSGEQLSKNILDAIADLGLDIQDCRGQGYDGAGAMAGIKNGCAAH